ncbi:hypothetical protein [Stenotrophomonas bentonitica]|uniref:Uncharacterized protein n=3 Tax=Stenotrophomonas TaxID=40323 RepID=A0ABU9JJ82_9GAMM
MASPVRNLPMGRSGREEDRALAKAFYNRDEEGDAIDLKKGDVPPRLSSEAVWSPILNDKEIGREEAL